MLFEHQVLHSLHDKLGAGIHHSGKQPAEEVGGGGPAGGGEGGRAGGSKGGETEGGRSGDQEIRRGERGGGGSKTVRQRGGGQG